MFHEHKKGTLKSNSGKKVRRRRAGGRHCHVQIRPIKEGELTTRHGTPARPRPPGNHLRRQLGFSTCRDRRDGIIRHSIPLADHRQSGYLGWGIGRLQGEHVRSLLAYPRDAQADARGCVGARSTEAELEKSQFPCAQAFFQGIELRSKGGRSRRSGATPRIRGGAQPENPAQVQGVMEARALVIEHHIVRTGNSHHVVDARHTQQVSKVSISS